MAPWPPLECDRWRPGMGQSALPRPPLFGAPHCSGQGDLCWAFLLQDPRGGRKNGWRRSCPGGEAQQRPFAEGGRLPAPHALSGENAISPFAPYKGDVPLELECTAEFAFIW